MSGEVRLGYKPGRVSEAKQGFLDCKGHHLERRSLHLQATSLNGENVGCLHGSARHFGIEMDLSLAAQTANMDLTFASHWLGFDKIGQRRCLRGYDSGGFESGQLGPASLCR